MAKTIASADITKLDFSVLLNLSLAVPVASVTNLSTVVIAANLQWVFEFYSPSGTPMYVGDFATPDVDGVPFTTFTIPGKIQEMFGHVEFGPNDYRVKVLVKDDAGNIFDLTKGKSLCAPNGWDNGRNNWGVASVEMQLKCERARLIVNDRTNFIYKSLEGTKVSTLVEVTYPKDPNGNVLTPFTTAALPTLVPLKYEGKGHELYVNHIYDYDLGDYFMVRIRYSFRQVFPVFCNVNLDPLYCEVDRVSAILQKDCSDTVKSRNDMKQLVLVHGKLLKAAVGILQPLSNFDVPAIVESIKEDLGITCDCCRPGGISSLGLVATSDASFTTNVTCGDMTAEFSDPDEAGNIVLNVGNKVYTFAMSDDAASSQAFEFQTTLNGCTKNTVLFVDKIALATEVLQDIQNNPTLLNILKDITQKAQLVCSGLTGGAAFNLSACTYNLEISTLVTGKTFDSIIINGTTYTAPANTLVTNAAAIQTYLNSLAKGTFVVTYSAGTNKTTIASAANVNALATVKTITGSVQSNIAFNNNCGLICTILQMIFDYLNQLNMVQITAGLELSVCRFNPETGVIFNEVFPPSTQASVWAKYISDSLCYLTFYIKDKLLTCDNLQKLFAAHTATTGNPNGSDIILMGMNGKCQKVPVRNLAMAIFQLLSTDEEVKGIYCQGAKCSVVSNCSPVTNIVIQVFDNKASVSWNTVSGATSYKWSIDGTTYNTVSGNIVLVTNLTADTAYNFMIYPVYNNGEGKDCEATEAFTTSNEGATCAAPAGLVLDNVTQNSFSATWNAVAGASGYQYRLNGGGWTNNGTALTIEFPGLTADTLYNFEVRAIIGGSPCAESSTASVTTDVTVYSATVRLATDAGAVCGATPVVVYSASSFGGGTQIYSDIALTDLVTGFTFITNTAGTSIYTINSGTATIGSPTGSICGGA